jgi:hypothetical protein
MLYFNSQFSAGGGIKLAVIVTIAGTFATFDNAKVQAFLVSLKNKITP